jgi:serine/threonine protein kinase
MTLAPGTRLGVYEIVGLIGAGGMGEVYRARDGRLQREVAIKVLPAAFAVDRDRLARFEREAQVLASLNHPNIAGIYGFDEPSDVASGFSRTIRALVLELVEGPTLADLIARSGGPKGPPLQPNDVRRGGSSDPPMPIDEALAIARQIAEALEAAHEHGIVHRDLKPANIKVRPDGTVKVLDFGLAKAFDAGDGAAPAALSMAPTLTSPAATGLGVILGTAAYMAPEQAKGKRVDKRADIWAFGCVLYEMLTGRRAFGGQEISETLAEMIRGESDWTALPAETPAAVRRLLRRCFIKDPKLRLSDAAALRLEIDEARDPVASADVSMPATGWSWRRVLPYGAVAVTVALLTGVILWLALADDTPLEYQPVRFAVSLPRNLQLANGNRQRIAISRDGRRIVYTATEANVGRLFVQPLDELEPAPIRGVERAGSIFLSPDGEWVGYNDPTSGAFRKVPLAGGPSATICEVPAATGGFRGATWGAEGRIVFSTGAAPGLMHVSDAGGVPEPLTSPPDGEIHRDPHFLPDGRHLLFVMSRTGEPDQVAAVSVDSPQPRVLFDGASPQYVSSGHIVYLREEA